MENAGRTNWAVEIRIIDDSGEEIERRIGGAIQVRGPTVMRRYLFDESDALTSPAGSKPETQF